MSVYINSISFPKSYVSDEPAPPGPDLPYRRRVSHEEVISAMTSNVDPSTCDDAYQLMQFEASDPFIFVETGIFTPLLPSYLQNSDFSAKPLQCTNEHYD